MAFFTLEDSKIAFSLFCTVYGIGTLGLPANFARSGVPIATIALLFMGFANICSCVAISKVCLAAPKNLKTYGDVGEWACGKFGRYIVLIAQFGVCCLVPCAYLVLGGILLEGISPGAFDQQYWSIIMAAMLLPVIVTPTLKEGAYAALAGCLGTVLADAIAIGVLANGIGNDHPSVPHPDISFSESAQSFGNLALAYSLAVMVPALQREHSQPERMPRVVATTMVFTTCCFLVIGETSFAYVGCQIPGNLLFAINGTALNLNANRGAVVLAYMFMQLHITIAMSVILNPVLYILERSILGMHKRPLLPPVDEESPAFNVINTPQRIGEKEGTSTPTIGLSGNPSITSMADAEHDLSPEALLHEYHNSGPVVIMKYVALRICVVVILLILAIVFKDHFMDFSDFIGAWAVSLACIILPIFFYLKVFWNTIPWYQKIIGTFICVVCAFLGCYVTYKTGHDLFLDIVSDKAFPYCPAEYDAVVYTNTTYYGNN
ncbi:Amino acid transporter AVT1I [Phytophthora citrophthora]|uniref:Amino acid transporter AVT1I n=1 Tax=Phytophthora citrophthora TaxID=4793 RepID=A0AAD9GPR6_9STRA|nr:Amino acid transporter AVT1I [Phytophthora citrophthora]